MKRTSLLLAAVLLASPPLAAVGAPFSAWASPEMKHGEMAEAVKHLQEAKAELAKDCGEYGGHRAAALKHADKAVDEAEAGSKAAINQAPPAVAAGDKEKHAEMRAALKHLKAAEKSLKKSDNDAGGHRLAAIGHARAAITEVEAGLKLVDD